MIDSVPKIKRLPWQVVVATTLWSVVFVGCGKTVPSGTVHGKVVLNDAPFADATVVFFCLETGQAGSADIQSDGTFRMENPLPIGKYTVYLAPKSAEDTGEKPIPDAIDQAVPDKYWNEGSSDIEIDILEGVNDNVTIRLEK